MGKLSDNHIHTDFSTDCDASAREMLLAAKQLSLSSVCFTDHMDIDFPSRRADGAPEFIFSVPEYFSALKKLQEENKDFPVFIGVELGLKENILPEATKLTADYPFDFVIASTHLVDNLDPYEPFYWEKYGEMAGINRYYEVTLENIRAGFDFDVYGHLDYVLRYCPTVKRAREQKRTEESFMQAARKDNGELIEEILSTLIESGRGIELNTAGLKYGLGHPNPHEDILKLYGQMGGTILTLGSDAHAPAQLAYAFDRVPGILRQCNFSFYTQFCGRKPVQCRAECGKNIRV